MDKTSEWISVAEAAEQLGRTQGLIRHLCRRRPGFAQRLGGSWRIRREAVDALLRERQDRSLQRQEVRP